MRRLSHLGQLGVQQLFLAHLTYPSFGRTALKTKKLAKATVLTKVSATPNKTIRTHDRPNFCNCDAIVILSDVLVSGVSDASTEGRGVLSMDTSVPVIAFVNEARFRFKLSKPCGQQRLWGT